MMFPDILHVKIDKVLFGYFLRRRDEMGHLGESVYYDID